MAGPLIDCYVLSPVRTAEAALRFLDRFLPDRQARFDPSDPSDVLGLPVDHSLSDVVSFLESHPSVAYTMYWSNPRDRPPHFAFLSFTSDGCLILGLSPGPDDRPALARRSLAEVLEVAGAKRGYLAVEEPPPSSLDEFLDRADAYDGRTD